MLHRLKDYYDEMLRCNRCGFCQAACPTYDVLHRESATARGRLQLLRALSEGKFSLSPAIAQYLYSCLDCRSCLLNCPGGVRTDEIFSLARKVLAESEAFPVPLRALGERVQEWHNVSGESNENRLSWSENLAAKPYDLIGQKEAEVLYFIGCVSGLYPMVYGIPQAFVEILTAAGVSFTTLGDGEWCCGYPLLAAGLPIEELAEHNIAQVKSLGVRRLVTTCPSCYHTWKEHYPAADFEILHASEFVLILLEEGRLPPLHPPAWEGALPWRVTYHDPCDLGRKSSLYEPPRSILRSIPGLELVEMSKNRASALCCGGGGNMETLEPTLAAEVARLRLSQAMETGAEAIVSACQQCERTLRMAARREKMKIKVLDVVEVVQKALS